MLQSVDGRIVTAGWNLPSRVLGHYERTAQTLDGQAWIVGRITMELYAGNARVPARASGPPISRTTFTGALDAKSYAIALDPSGKLRWKSNSIDGQHVIAVLTEQASDDYLAFLQSKRVSYLFGGKTELNLRTVLGKIRKDFAITTLLLEGGGKINGSFLAADLIDELSILIAPIADGAIGTPSLFDARDGKGFGRFLKLISVESRAGDVLWLRYKRKRSSNGRRPS